MSIDSNKCSRCGAPINWSRASLITTCEFCGNPISRTSKYLIGAKNSIPEITFVFSKSLSKNIKERSNSLIGRSRSLIKHRLNKIKSKLEVKYGKEKTEAILTKYLPIGITSTSALIVLSFITLDKLTTEYDACGNKEYQLLSKEAISTNIDFFLFEYFGRDFPPIKHASTNKEVLEHKKNYKRELKAKLDNCNKAISKDSNNVEAYRIRASIKGDRYDGWGVHDYKGAIKDLGKIIKINSTDVDAYRQRAELKKVLHNYKGAIKDLDMIIKINSTDVDAYRERARLKEKLGDFSGAKIDRIFMEKSKELDAELEKLINKNLEKRFTF